MVAASYWGCAEIGEVMRYRGERIRDGWNGTTNLDGMAEAKNRR